LSYSVLKVDPSSGAVVASWPVPAEVKGVAGTVEGGLEYLNGAIWIVGRNNRVFKLSSADGAVIGTGLAPAHPYDLAKSGTAGQMWMVEQRLVYLVEVGE
jgi:hypothetical protein